MGNPIRQAVQVFVKLNSLSHTDHKMAADKILYDARSLLTALKSLDDVMKSSLKSLETDKNKGFAASSKAGPNNSVKRTGAGTAAGEEAPKVEVIKRTDRVMNIHVVIL